MAYTGAGVGRGVEGAGAAFANLFAQMLGARKQEEARAQDMAYRTSRDQASDALTREQMDATAAYRDAQLAGAEADRAFAREQARVAGDRAEQHHRDELASTGRTVSHRTGDSAMVQAPMGGSVPMPKVEREITYDPEKDWRVQQQRAIDSSRTDNSIRELQERSRLNPPSASTSDPDATARRQLVVAAVNAVNEAAQEYAGDPNIVTHLNQIAQNHGYGDINDLRRQAGAIVGSQGPGVSRDPTAPQGGRPVNPELASAVFGGGGSQEPPTPEAGQALEIAKQLQSQGRSPQDIAALMNGEGVNLSDTERQYVLSALGIGR